MGKLKNTYSGSVLVLVVIAMVVLMFTGLGLLAMGVGSRIFAFRDGEAMAAKCAADAGIMRQVYQMNYDLRHPAGGSGLVDGAITLPLETLPNGATFNASRDGTWVGTAVDYVLDSTGSYNNATRVVHAKLRAAGIWDNSIVVKNALDLGNNFVINGDILVTDPNGILDGSGTVNGNVYVTGNNLTPFGGVTPTKVDYDTSMPIISAPSGLPDKGGGINVPGGTVLTASDSGVYHGSIKLLGNLTINGNVTLVVDANFGNPSLNNADLTVNANSSLTLYVGGDVRVKNDFNVNNLTLDPSKFVIYGTKTTAPPQVIKVKNNGDVFGLIYAPNGNVTIKNGFQLSGSVVANRIIPDIVDNNAIFNYSTSVRQYNKNSPGVTLVIQKWYE